MQVFTVYAGQLNGILSPLFFISNLKDDKGYIQLSDIAIINPHKDKKIIRLDDKVPYVGLPETDKGKITNVLYRPYREVKGRGVIKQNDILFARIEPSIFNKKYIFVSPTDLKENYAFTSTEFYVIKTNSEKVIQKYLYYSFFFDSVFNQIKGKTTGSTGRRRLDRNALLKVKIPNPKVEVQNRIVEILDYAHKQKQQKEKEAQELLDSIDDYVMSELGIIMPEMKNEMTFIVNSDEVAGKRLDVEYINPRYKIYYEAISNGKYEIQDINDVATQVFQGVGKNETDSSTIKLLKVKNIKQNNEIDFENVEYVKNVPQNKILHSGDIISPFIGEAIRQYKFSVFNITNSSFTVDNNTGVIRINNKKANSDYVVFVLNSILGKIQLDQLIGGGGVPFLGSENAKKLKIPLPSIDIQNRIVLELNSRLKKAKQLHQEAFEDLEQAKKQVEKMILSNN